MAPLLAILSALLCGCQAVEYGWTPNKEFVYSVQGQNVAGLPQLKSQYSGFHFHGDLRVQSHSPRLLLLKVVNMNYTKIHQELPEGWWNGGWINMENQTRTLPLTTSTVVVQLTRSMSPEMVVQADLDDWQVNFLKGLVSNILTFNGEQSTNNPNLNRQFQPPSRDVYSVMEQSVVGECEVMYEVGRMLRYPVPGNKRLCGKQPLWEVTKTRNYSNCHLLSEDHAHLPLQDCTPGGANCGRFWTRVSLTQMVGCGEKNNVTLLSSVTSSGIAAQLHLQNNSHAVINTNVNITLLSISDITKRFNPPQNKQTLKSLLYTYSFSPKVFSSRTCQDTNNVSDEGRNTNETQVPQKNERGTRDKRGIKRKYGKESRPFSNSSENNRFTTDNPENYNTSSNDYGSKTDIKDSYGGGKPWTRPLKDSQEQPSEEMQLEEQWKISSKDSKNVPPHQPFTMFTLAHRTSFDLSCLNPKLRQIITEIASDLEDTNIMPEKQTLDNMNLAVDICRTLPLDQLSSISEEVFQDHHSISKNKMKLNERRVFRDIIVMCGTHPALQLIKGWIERQEAEGEEAAEMIASLPSHIFSPTKYLVKDFFDMVQHLTEQEDNQLTTTALLALSNLVRHACVNQKSRERHFSSIIKPVCDQSLTQQITDWIIKQLDSQTHMRRVYIEALGNTGSSDIIPTLTRIALNSKQPTYLQTSAVFAMRYQVLYGNPEMAPQLLALYHNYSLPAGTRVAAASMLMYANIDLTMWERLAIATWYEPDLAVAQFIASSIQTMATSHDSLYAKLTKSASLVLPLVKPTKVSVHLPFNLMTSWLSKSLEEIILQQLTWMWFQDTTNFYYRHTSRFSGFSWTDIEASLATANLDDFWGALRELMGSINPGQKTQKSSKDLPHTLAKIKDALNLKSRTMPELQAELRLKINNMMERMLVMNRDTFKSWAKGGRKMVAEVQQGGKSFSYQKADMNSFHISSTTELGFPVEFTVRTPWMVHAKLDVNVTKEGNGIMAGGQFMYSSQLMSSVSLMSPWDNTMHSAGAYASNFLQLPPFRLTFHLDIASNLLRITTSFVDQHRLLYFFMQPFTSQRKLKIHQPTLLSKETIKVKLGDSVQVPIYWMSRYLNSVYSLEETESFDPMDFVCQMRSVMGFIMMAPNMDPRSFETVMNPLYPVSINLSMSMASKSMGLLEIEPVKDSLFGNIFNTMIRPDYTDWSSPVHSGETQASNTTTEASQSEKVIRIHNKKSFRGDMKTPVSSEERGILINSSPANGKGYSLYSTTYDSATDSFNASVIDPFSNMVNGSSHYYLIEKIFMKINSGKAVVFEFNMWSTNPVQSIKLSAFATYASTFSQRASRFGVFTNTDYSKIFATAVLEAPIDIATDLKRRVSEDLVHQLFVDYVGQHKGYTTRLFLQAKLAASRARLAQLKTSPQLEICSQRLSQYFDSGINEKCQQLQAQAREIGSGNITIYYDNLSNFLEKIAQKYINTAKVMLPRTDEGPGEGSNTISLMFDVNPRTESVDTCITTPASSLNIHRTPISVIPMSTFLEWAMQDSPKEYCGISSHRVMTFDRAQFQHNMDNSWYLVTADCSNKYAVSIMAQSTSNRTMVVEVNINDQFSLTMKDGPQVSVNNKAQPMNETQALLLLTDDNGSIVAHTVFTPDHSIHVHLPQHKLDFVYSGSSLILYAKQELRGRLCGLCGSYSNPGMENFISAHGLPDRSPMEFAASYKITEQ